MDQKKATPNWNRREAGSIIHGSVSGKHIKTFWLREVCGVMEREMKGISSGRPVFEYFQKFTGFKAGALLFSFFVQNKTNLNCNLW